MAEDDDHFRQLKQTKRVRIIGDTRELWVFVNGNRCIAGSGDNEVAVAHREQLSSGGD